MELKAGIKHREETLATEKNSAKSLGSGLVDVFATPMMVLLVESTASNSVLPCLGEDQATVGTVVNVKHTAATPIGMTVWCETELVEVDGKRLVFKAEVFDECGKVGEGTHERFIISVPRFMERTQAKLSQRQA